MNDHKKTDERIVQAIKKLYKDVEPSEQLQERISSSYKQQQYDESIFKTQNNFVTLFRSKYFAFVGSMVTIVLVVGVAIYINDSGSKIRIMCDVDTLLEESIASIDQGSIYEIIADVDENMDTLALLAQSDGDVTVDTTDTKNSVDNVIGTDINELDDVVDVLDSLDELESIFDDEIFDDEIFS